jgi:AMP nucleosidase
MNSPQTLPLDTAPQIEPQEFTDPRAAVEHLITLHRASVAFLVDRFRALCRSGEATARYRAFYPEIRLTTSTYDIPDSRLSFGYVSEPGTYSTTVTRPDLFAHYLRQQIGLLLKNHNVPVSIGYSATPIPLHFAMVGQGEVVLPEGSELRLTLRDVFDVPDLSTTNDDIVNGTATRHADGSFPLAPFTAQRVDYSLARLAHYTATDAEHFQNHVLFTNYQFYVDEFEAYARAALADPSSGYTALVMPGNAVITDPAAAAPVLPRLPQMPAYHLVRERGQGITLVNIGVGPSNAKPPRTISPSCGPMPG